ncbi:MAG: hypothetical protein NTAFB05_00260 [Nitrobacter sp.]
MTVSTAGERVGSQIGRAARADTAGSAGKGKPPAAREARNGFGFGRAAGGDLRQRRGMIPPVALIATKKLKTHAATIKLAQFILELRRSPILKRLHICLPAQPLPSDDY